jgi:hypothetical protein
MIKYALVVLALSCGKDTRRKVTKPPGNVQHVVLQSISCGDDRTSMIGDNYSGTVFVGPTAGNTCVMMFASEKAPPGPCVAKYGNQVMVTGTTTTTLTVKGVTPNTKWDYVCGP